MESLEQNFEQCTEALLTMKNARSRLQEIRKDRGYGKAGDSKPHGLGNKAGGMPRPKAKQVRLAEALNTEFATPSPVSSAHASSTIPSAGGVASEPMHHEASIVHRLSVPLHEALSQPTQRDDLMQCPSQGLAEDKYSVGALDSACNRTCCGPAWMDTYLKKLSDPGRPGIASLASTVDEQERFKFGNGGLVASTKRISMPASVSGKVLLIWVSVVPAASLGCLLGRDFLNAVGAVLNFADRTL